MSDVGGDGCAASGTVVPLLVDGLQVGTVEAVQSGDGLHLTVRVEPWAASAESALYDAPPATADLPLPLEEITDSTDRRDD